MDNYSDKPQHECGVFGISSRMPNEAARQTFFGLFALQHRGQEAAGIAVSDGERMALHKGQGLVNQVFSEDVISQLEGKLAIGHTRYSTTGSSSLENVQPMQFNTKHGPVALAHNGNLVNAAELRKELLDQGMGLVSSTDTEVMLAMLARAKGAGFIKKISNCMPKWIGAYSIVILTLDGIFAARDPWGLRPLTIGSLSQGGYAVASETGALQVIGCHSIREVNPGEVIDLHNSALIVNQALPVKQPQAKCTFEHIYFSRPDSIWDGKVVHQVRRRLGEQVAKEFPIEADVVVPVPDSSIPAALGYAVESQIPYDIGLLKNRYIGRTFIQPSESSRKKGVDMKYSPIDQVLSGQRVILIDDSIVRGTTAKRLVKLIREAGAKEVHFCITCPPIIAPCFMGVDMSTPEELIASNFGIEEIKELLGADSLNYISLEGMMTAINSIEGYCNACFTGTYPFEVNQSNTKYQFESSKNTDGQC
ncbi:MAG: amidophosphoribosyltransferase [Chloroflexota bacterium]